jgi:beta-glucosidase
MAVRYPFGHGLSYTTFEYSDIALSSNSIRSDDELTVTATITNTGHCDGKEVVQLYVSDVQSSIVRPKVWQIWLWQVSL